MAKKTNNNPEIIDIASILSQEVHVSENTAVMLPDDEDFQEPEFLEDDNPKIDENGDQQYADDSQYDNDPIILSANDTAESLIDALDGLQTFGLSVFVKKKMFTDKENEILQTLDTTGGTAYPVNSPEEKILKRYNRYLALEEKFPFNDSEKRRLINGTARYVKQVDLKLTPLTGLLMVFAGVATKRFSIYNSAE
jgi:hypothetical protein